MSKENKCPEPQEGKICSVPFSNLSVSEPNCYALIIHNFVSNKVINKQEIRAKNI